MDVAFSEERDSEMVRNMERWFESRNENPESAVGGEVEPIF